MRVSHVRFQVKQSQGEQSRSKEVKEAENAPRAY